MKTYPLLKPDFEAPRDSDRSNSDDFVKCPYATLRFILRRCGVHQSTTHSSGFTRLPLEHSLETAPENGYEDLLQKHQQLGFRYFHGRRNRT
jgi:hypothetical protein